MVAETTDTSFNLTWATGDQRDSASLFYVKYKKMGKLRYYAKFQFSIY